MEVCIENIKSETQRVSIIERANDFDKKDNSLLKREIKKLIPDRMDVTDSDIYDFEGVIGSLGLELILVKIEGHKPLVVLDTAYYDSRFKCLGCSSYFRGAPTGCLDSNTGWCRLNGGTDDMPGWR